MNGADQTEPPFLQGWDELPPFVMRQQDELPPFVEQQDELPPFVTRQKPEPEGEGMFGTFSREFAHGAPPAVAGAVAGMGAGGLTGALVPVPGATLAGGLIGGIAGGYYGSKATEAGAKLIGIDDDLQRAANVKAHPWSAAAGQAFSNILGFGPGAAAKGVRAAGAAIGGGIAAGSELYHRGSELFTPEGFKEAVPSILLQGAVGAAFPNPYTYAQKAEQLGVRAGQYFRPPPVAPLPHGSPGPTAAGGVAEAKAPPVDVGVPQPANTARDAKPVTPPEMAGETGARMADELPPPERLRARAEELRAEGNAALADKLEQAAAGIERSRAGRGGVNVLEPGRADPTVEYAINAEAEPVPPAEPARPVEEPPGPATVALPPAAPGSPQAIAEQIHRVAGTGQTTVTIGGKTATAGRPPVPEAPSPRTEPARPGPEAPRSPASPVDSPVADFIRQNRQEALRVFSGTPMEARILEMARAGKTAGEISQATGIEADTVRVLRDNAGIAPVNLEQASLSGMQIPAEARRAEAGAPPRGAIEVGAEGKPQLVIPGAERISDAQIAQRRAAERLRPEAPQRPMDEGLFGDTRAQDELFARLPPEPRAAPEPAAAAVMSDTELRAARQQAVEQFNAAAAQSADARTSPQVAAAKARVDELGKELLARRARAQQESGVLRVPDVVPLKPPVPPEAAARVSMVPAKLAEARDTLAQGEPVAPGLAKLATLAERKAEFSTPKSGSKYLLLRNDEPVGQPGGYNSQKQAQVARDAIIARETAAVPAGPAAAANLERIRAVAARLQAERAGRGLPKLAIREDQQPVAAHYLERLRTAYDFDSLRAVLDAMKVDKKATNAVIAEIAERSGIFVGRGRSTKENLLRDIRQDWVSKERWKTIVEQDWEEAPRPGTSQATNLIGEHVEYKSQTTAQGQRDVDRFYPALREELDRIGLSDVALNLASKFQLVVDGLSTGSRGSAIGKLINVAIGGKHKVGEAFGILHHEALHVARTLGLFKDAEWKILSEASDAKWRRQYGIDVSYAQWNRKEVLTEEGIAHAYEDWVKQHIAAGKPPAATATVTPKEATLFQRIKDFFTAIRNTFRRTPTLAEAVRRNPEDIFRAFYEGKLTERSPGAADELRLATPSTPPVPPAAGATSPPGQGPPPAGSVAAAHTAIAARIAPQPSWWNRIPTSLADVKNTWRQVYTAAKNAFDPLEQLAKKGPALSPEEDFNVLARLTRGLPGRVLQQLEHGTYDIKTGKVNGDPLAAVLKPVENDERFVNYAVAKRAIELEARGIKTGMPLAEANTVVAADAQRYEPVLRELLAFKDRVFDNLQKSGVLSADAVQKMRALNKSHVPFYRLLDPKSELGQQLGAGAGLKVHDPVHGIKGSEREIHNPLDSIIKDTYVFTDIAHRNLAMQAMEDWAIKHDPNGQFMRRVRDVHPVTVTPEEINQFMKQHGIPASLSDAMTIFRPNAFRPAPDRVRVFRDGKSRVYEVDPAVGNAVNAMDRESLNMLTRILSQPARLLRAGAVLAPEFIIRNPIRDQFSALVNSKYGYVPVYDMLRGMGHLWNKSEQFQSWLIEGGANATLVGLDRKAIGLEPKSVAGRVKNVITSPIEALRVASEFMENATRMGEFLRATEKGASPTAAAFSSREVSLDFARMGAKAQAFNSLIPFFNAQIEGVDRAARAFRDNPAGFLTKVGMSITLPSTLLWFANKDDERYKELPQWQKDLFWIVPTDKWVAMKPEDASKVGTAFKRQLPNGQWQRNDGIIWRIPKPFELGVLFGSVPERALDAYYAHNPHAFKDLHKSVTQALLPNFIPQAVTPLVEQFANRSTFLDRTLVPKYLENVAPKYQFTPQTSEVAKKLGNIISSFKPDTSFASPIIIDNYLRQYTGGLGKHVVDLMDRVLEASGDVAPRNRPAATAADTPLLKAFAARFPDAGAQSIQDFYDTYAERKEAKTTLKYLQKRGETDADLAREATAEGVHKLIGTLHKRVRDVVEDKKMEPERKREVIDTLYLQMIGAARRGNALFERTKRQQAA